MSKKRANSLAKRLTPVLNSKFIPEFHSFHNMVIGEADNDLLLGIALEPSRFESSDFYIYAFLQPLFVPAEDVHFTMGRRIRNNGSELWNFSDKNLEFEIAMQVDKQASDIFNVRSINQNLIEFLESLEVDNPHAIEALAYSYVYLDDFSTALDVIASLEKELDCSIAWQRQILARVRVMRSAILENMESAQKLLNSWGRQTKKLIAQYLQS